MNVFDLPGPAFLGFYILFAALVWGGLYAALAVPLGAASPLRSLLGDPYQIACLRGGVAEAARIALVSLADRGLLEIPRPGVVVPADKPVPPGLHPIERAILVNCPRPLGDAPKVIASPPVKAACQAVCDPLVARGLAPGPSAQAGRAAVCLLAGLVVVVVGIVKLEIAMERGRSNVGFLIIAIIVSGVCFALLARPRPATREGVRMLADLRRLLDRRKTAIRAQAKTSEALLLASVFGAAGLIGFSRLQAAYAGTRRPVTSSSCSSTSSCGSSGCGGGGGCGGCGSS